MNNKKNSFLAIIIILFLSIIIIGLIYFGNKFFNKNLNIDKSNFEILKLKDKFLNNSNIIRGKTNEINKNIKQINNLKTNVKPEKTKKIKITVSTGDQERTYYKSFDSSLDTPTKYGDVVLTYYPNGKIKKEVDYVNGLKEGKEIFYYQNGTVAKETTYINDKKYGDFFENYENGILKISGKFVDNRLDGLITTYNSNGQKQSETNYTLGLKNGKSTEYISGKVLSEVIYKNGKKEGYFFANNFNGGLEIEGNFVDDKKNGVWTKYNRDRKIILEETYHQGILEGEYNKYYDTGSIKESGTYINGYLEGTVEIYNENSNLIRKINYIKGKKEGKSESYYSDGKLLNEEYYRNNILNGEFKEYSREEKVTLIGKYSNGMRSGEWKGFDETGKNTDTFLYNENGQLNGKIINFIPTDFSRKEYFRKETEFKDGILEGSFIMYDTKNKISEKGYYKNNEKDGQWLNYTDNILLSEENFKNGRRDGKQIYYYTNGKISKEYIFRDGKEIEFRSYSEDGKLTFENKR